VLCFLVDLVVNYNCREIFQVYFLAKYRREFCQQTNTKYFPQNRLKLKTTQCITKGCEKSKAQNIEEGRANANDNCRMLLKLSE
jgi:hypothetical protein